MLQVREKDEQDLSEERRLSILAGAKGVSSRFGKDLPSAGASSRFQHVTDKILGSVSTVKKLGKEKRRKGSDGNNRALEDVANSLRTEKLDHGKCYYEIMVTPTFV